MFREGRIVLVVAIFILFLFQPVCNTRASEPQGPQAGEIHQKTNIKNKGARHEKFETGHFMFNHIGDDHEWHIIDIKNTIVSIPLPVILYSKQKGIVLFLSSKFQHGRSEYNGFRLETHGDNKGKIIETLDNGTEIIPLDISMTKNVAAIFVSVILILFLFIRIANAYKRDPLSPPKGLQSLLEPVILFIRDDVAKSSIGEKKYEKFVPFLLTIFFFILINNLLGLVPFFPGGANVTGNIAVTMVLAFFTFVITSINGNKVYWKHIFNTPGVPVWLKIPIPIMPVVELVGIFTKPFVLMIRLFANISAGHMVGLGFLSLIFLFGEMNKYLGMGISVVSVSFMVFMTFMEILVAFIQAYVFTFLSALYFGMAVEEHH